jgi:hypothetical protein
VVNVSMGQAADPLALVRVPGRCHDLLRLLLDLLLHMRRTQAVRLQLYAALLQYLQFCRCVCQLCWQVGCCSHRLLCPGTMHALYL